MDISSGKCAKEDMIMDIHVEVEHSDGMRIIPGKVMRWLAGMN